MFRKTLHNPSHTQNPSHFRLDANGICHGEPRYPIDPHHVNICRDFLQCCDRTKIARLSSYWLKHRVERWARHYVSNGACIQAALDLGLTTEHFGGPNVDIGVSLGSALKLCNEAVA